jgi:hypothetical protein
MAEKKSFSLICFSISSIDALQSSIIKFHPSRKMCYSITMNNSGEVLNWHEYPDRLLVSLVKRNLLRLRAGEMIF